VKRILVVEDDVNLSTLIVDDLLAEKYEVSRAKTLSEARAMIGNSPPDLVILDWNLPDGEGIRLLNTTEFRGGRFSVILLTARSTPEDVETALLAGAIDYIRKPFHMRELLLRVRIRMGEQGRIELNQSSPKKISGAFEINDLTKRVFFHGKEVALSKMEFNLMCFFIQREGEVLSREQILENVWGDCWGTNRTVDTHSQGCAKNFIRRILKPFLDLDISF
jgi:DNA-binding response OmpR family regulator